MRRTLSYFVLLALMTLAAFALAAGQQQANSSKSPGSSPAPPVPESLREEHAHLHEELAALLNSGGRTGEAAKTVAERLETHFRKEEEFALPQLSLLPRLARGDELTSSELQSARETGRKLRTDLPAMLGEHRSIVAALEEMGEAGRAENKPEASAFAQRLKLHARHEEEILYPAALLVGDYVSLKAGEAAGARK